MIFHNSSAIRELIDNVELDHSIISNQIDKINDNIKALRPNDYELQINSLQNEIKKLNSIINNQKIALEKQKELIDSMLNYLENLEEIKKAGGLKVHYSPNISNKSNKLKIVKIPEFYIYVCEKVECEDNG